VSSPTSTGAVIEVRGLSKRFGSIGGGTGLDSARSRARHRVLGRTGRARPHFACCLVLVTPTAGQPRSPSPLRRAPTRCAMSAPSSRATHFHPGPPGPPAPEDDDAGERDRRVAHRRGARAVGLADSAQRRWGFSLGMAPATGARRRPSRRSGRAHPGRAVQRPRPPGHRLAARVPPPPRRPGPDHFWCPRTSWPRWPRRSTTWSSSPVQLRAQGPLPH